ncbi:MAG: hypothetical protein LBJ71_01455 [Holosporaceae bacterium]|jgi:hypothetical protein|nr:hypothetical protein [Holosporaceae bacterium]
MRKVLIFLCCSFSAAFVVAAEYSGDESKTAGEFLDLGEPEKEIGGAYAGLGVTLSRISHNLKAKGTAASSSEVNLDSSGNQWDVSLIGGFGSAFYKRYYAGIEMDFFKRISGNTKYSSNRDIAIVHNSTMGLNMDIRFGYLYPQGYLIYSTIGFARVLGRGLFKHGTDYVEGSFGSFYPTFGVGLEKKMNHRWNIRADFHISLTSKDDNKSKSIWKYEAKPKRMAFRISITRSI